MDVIYYAHSMSMYDSEREAEELKTLFDFFPNGVIYNPNRPYIQENKNPMTACLSIIKSHGLTGVAFSVNPPHFVSAGVYSEVKYAQRLGKSLYEIRGNKIRFAFYPRFRLVKHDKAGNWAQVL